MNVMDNGLIIKCENIAKRYEGNDILKNVSLTCKRGEAIALVGANGCGKSTLLRILAGVTRPSSGEVIYAHSNIKISFIPDHFEKLDIPVGKLLKYMLEGYDLKDADMKMKRLCEQFRIDKLLGVPLKHLSKGSLQKIATIQALACENDLVLMDEPLSGQDMMSKLCFIQEVLDRKKAGMSIIMACHEKEIIEEIADRVLLLEEGMLSEGYDYIYQSGLGKGAFLLELKEEDFEELFGDVETLSVSGIGNKCRIILKREDSQRVFGICLDHKIRIIRYEEIDE